MTRMQFLLGGGGVVAGGVAAGCAGYRMVGLLAPAITGRNVPGKANHL